jgi:hypothetical protein
MGHAETDIASFNPCSSAAHSTTLTASARRPQIPFAASISGAVLRVRPGQPIRLGEVCRSGLVVVNVGLKYGGLASGLEISYSQGRIRREARGSRKAVRPHALSARGPFDRRDFSWTRRASANRASTATWLPQNSPSRSARSNLKMDDAQSLAEAERAFLGAARTPAPEPAPSQSPGRAAMCGGRREPLLGAQFLSRDLAILIRRADAVGSSQRRIAGHFAWLFGIIRPDGGDLGR